MRILFLPLLLLVALPVFAQDEIDDLLAMSLEDLLQVKISDQPALTKLSMAEQPASITVITAEDIKNTPARNILDLIEIYVPGAIWMNYEEGPQLGIRGNISHQNTKYLLRLNGRLMNNKGQYGAKSELEQWDMSDIHHIEIVRGAGSVTYGPGAVAGIINIITHTADTAPGLLVTGRYLSNYNSKNISIRHGYKGDKVKIFSFASVSQTAGFGANNFIGLNTPEAGYIGEDILLDSEPLDYFADYQDQPQIKLHLDLTFLNDWRLWTRYTQQGSTWHGNETKTDFGSGPLNQQGTRDRQFAITLQHDKDISDSLSLTSMLSLDLFDVERRKGDLFFLDPDHVLNKKIDFSESELFFRTIFNWQATEKVEFAFGGEFSFDSYGIGWGDDKKDMRLGENGIIISGPDSNALSTGSRGSADKERDPIFVGDGWSSNTYSLLAESKFVLSPGLSLLLSARADKNSYSRWLFSPRIALITDVADEHYLKIILQQSQRMATAGQLYSLDLSGIKSNPETIGALEIIYSAFAERPLSFSFAAFLHDAEVIAWDQNAQATNLIGRLQLFGFEPEISYKLRRGRIGLNYSYVKQLDWQLSEGVLASGISYSDYNQPLGGSEGVQTGFGNDLNNWPNQALKLFGRSAISDQLTLHIDACLLWDFQGAKDGLTGLSNAVSGLPQEAAVSTAIDTAYEVGAYDYDFRLNASMNYQFNESFSAMIYAQNLLGANGNKRYSYDTSNNKASPKRVRFVEEPAALGLTVRYQF